MKIALFTLGVIGLCFMVWAMVLNNAAMELFGAFVAYGSYHEGLKRYFKDGL